MNKVEDMRRRYNPGNAEDMPLGEWETPNHWKLHTAWGADEAFEQCIMDSDGNIVGKVIKGLHYSGPQGIANFGLFHRVRRIADVAEVQAKRQARHEAKRAKAEAAKEQAEVVTITFDKDWNVLEKTTERRTVYSSSTRKFIKTRSHGSPTAHPYKGKYYVVFGVNLSGRTVYQKVWNDGLVTLLDKHG
jgi:hypothetical protein